MFFERGVLLLFGKLNFAVKSWFLGDVMLKLVFSLFEIP
jgi:hypothetical protein